MSVVGSAKENEATGCCGWLALRRGSPQVCGTFPVCNERRRRAGGEQAGTRRREWRESEAPPRPPFARQRERGTASCGKGHREGRGAVGGKGALVGGTVVWGDAKRAADLSHVASAFDRRMRMQMALAITSLLGRCLREPQQLYYCLAPGRTHCPRSTFSLRRWHSFSINCVPLGVTEV